MPSVAKARGPWRGGKRTAEKQAWSGLQSHVALPVFRREYQGRWFEAGPLPRVRGEGPVRIVAKGSCGVPWENHRSSEERGPQATKPRAGGVCQNSGVETGNYVDLYRESGDD